MVKRFFEFFHRYPLEQTTVADVTVLSNPFEVSRQMGYGREKFSTSCGGERSRARVCAVPFTCLIETITIYFDIHRP